MKMKMSVLRVAVLSLLCASTACQQEAGKSASATAAGSAAPQLTGNQDLSVIGENLCLGCSLKKEQSAKAQCSVYGHRHALRVESAKSKEGQDLPALGGQTLHYLDNDQSAPLLKEEGFHKKRVEVKGRLFAAERTLEVGEVKAL